MMSDLVVVLVFFESLAVVRVSRTVTILQLPVSKNTELRNLQVPFPRPINVLSSQSAFCQALPLSCPRLRQLVVARLSDYPYPEPHPQSGLSVWLSHLAAMPTVGLMCSSIVQHISRRLTLSSGPVASVCLLTLAGNAPTIEPLLRMRITWRLESSCWTWTPRF